MIAYHVSHPGLSPGLVLTADYGLNRGKANVFYRACIQGPDVLAATLAAAEYADELMGSLMRSMTPALPTISVPSANAPKWATEGLLEYVRWHHYRSRPERSRSIFLFGSVELARNLISNFREGTSMAIYACNVHQPSVMWTGNMNQTTRIDDTIRQETEIRPLASVFSDLVALAHDYWRGAGEVEWPEILVVGGSVTILERVE